MLFRRQQPAEGAAPAAPAVPAAPIVPAGPVVVAPESDPPKTRKVKLAVQKFRTDVYRIALRMKYPTRASVMQQLMYRLGMAERIHLGTAAGQQQRLDELALADAERCEALQQPPLTFGCTIMVLGLNGVGKSATINSLLGRAQPTGYKETGKVEVVRGEVAGIPLTFIDTPGLEPSAGAIASNLRKLHAAKRAFNKYKPQAVLYIDRLDAGRRDMADLNVLRSITEVFGQDIWFTTVLLLTHGGSAPPDTSAGQPMTFEMYYQQRGQQAQTLLRQVAGDQRLLNPIALAENSAFCPRSAEGDLVLPNGTPWCRQLLMLLFTTKVLNEANSLLKPGEGRAANARAQQFMGMKVPPLGWLLSRLVDFRSPRKPAEDERGIMKDEEIRKLEPHDQTTQLRKKRAYLRQRADEARAGDDGSAPILAPEPPLAPSFDPEVTGYRYQVLESPSGIIARPIISDGAIDHEDGIDSVQVEKQAVLRPKGQYLGGIPAVAWAQTQKDKTQFSFQGEADGSYFHTSKWVSSAACNVQTIGRDVLYTPRIETRLKTGRRNKVAIGAMFSRLGEEYSHPFKGGALAYGLKLDERVRVLPNAKLRGSIGRMYVKAGQSLDQGTALACDLKIKPSYDETARILMGGTAVWQRREVVMGGNLSTEFKLPKSGGKGGKSDTLCSMNANLNNKGNGQLVLRVNSHDYPSLAYSMGVPVLMAMWQKLFGKEEF